MAILAVIAKAVEPVSKALETGVVRQEPWEKPKGPIENKPIPKIESIHEGSEFPVKEVLSPDVEVIKNESLQQLLESNREKLQEIRDKFSEEREDEFGNGEDSENTNENEDIPETDEDSEGEELTEDEINEKQKAAIKEALERIRNGEKLTNEELGNLGEMMMDQYYISKGYKPLNKHRVTSLDDKKGGFKTGIDGVYEKTNPDGTKTYVIADAKYNTSQLSETNDGKQMSDNWIDKRLDDAVGKEKADEIRDAAEDDPDSVKHEVYHIDPSIDENGNMHTDTQEVDSEGNKVGDKTIVEYFDAEGNRIDPSPED